MGRSHVTWALVAAAALALGACGPKAGAPASSAVANGGGGFGGLFPAPSASYKATYTLVMGPKDGTMTIYSSGKKTRSENSMMAASTGLTSVTLMDRDAMQFVTYMEGPKAPKRATKLSADDIKRFDEIAPRPDAAMKPAKIGTDNVAGLACNVWQLPLPPGAPAADTADADGARQLCLTDDGIMLRAGSAAKPRLVATSVEKGPQDPALFALPPGYEVIDMGDCMNVMRQYGEAMRNGGAKPDQAKFAECQKKMMSGFGAP